MRLVCLFLIALVTAANAKHYRLFVLTGQSNSLGTTGGGEDDLSPGIDPADTDVRFYWDNVADASNSLGSSGGVWTGLQAQQGGFYPGNATHWGPEIDFSRSLYRAGVRDFGIIKASRGGGGNTNWSKSSGGHMYEHVKQTVDVATAALTVAGDTFEIVGFLYVQGESDSGGEASIADTRLDELISNLRADLPNASSMHAVVGGIAAAGGNRDMVRIKQAELAAGDLTIDYFENLDLQEQLYDSLHFERAAKLMVGKRFARAFFEAGVVASDYGKLVFVGDSITQGGLGFSSYRYEVFQHLVDAGAGFSFVGSVNGAYQSLPGVTPDYQGVAFANIHEGHFGWRASWENGRVPLPATRRSGNRGEGTVLNWTGQAVQYELGSAGNLVSYPDPGASGSGNIGTIYLADTVVMMVGINDLADGTSPEQLRDDIATMIDQYRAANGSVSIFLNHLLHTDQAASLQTNVDLLNAMLQPLADDKNSVMASSPVWVIDASTGFDPVTMTHDKVHPNLEGEVFVGRRIAEGLGLFPKVVEVIVPVFPSIERKDLEVCFAGDEIFNGTKYINGWSEVTAPATTESLSGSVLNRNHINGAGEWLEGMSSSKDGGVTTWNSGNDGDWTFEIEMKFLANPAGFAIWLGTDTHRVIVEIFGGNTADNGANDFNEAHNNLDGGFHQWRIVNESEASKYHVWRDGERLTPVEGANYDSVGNDSRVVLGDRTGGGFGNNYQVEIAKVCYDQSGGYLPRNADFDGDGLSDEFELRYFQSLTDGLPDGDEDGDGRSNLEEFGADTDPTDQQSFFKICKLIEFEGKIRVSVEESSVGRIYELYQSDDLGQSDHWSLIAGPRFGNGGLLNLDDPVEIGSGSFYRLGVGLPER